jgi:hypothetical protein
MWLFVNRFFTYRRHEAQRERCVVAIGHQTVTHKATTLRGP